MKFNAGLTVSLLEFVCASPGSDGGSGSDYGDYRKIIRTIQSKTIQDMPFSE